MSTTAEIQARIDQIKDTDLPNARAAMTALITGQHHKYELDTGQSREVLQRLNLKDLRWLINQLTQELNALENSIGTSATIMEPSW